MKIKYLLNIFLSVFFLTVQSQSDKNIVSNIETHSGFKLSHGDMVTNPPNDVKGSQYLFKTWYNKNYVHLLDATSTIKLNNINVNVEVNKFTTKINDNSVFYFNQDYFNYVIIDNRRFELIYELATNSKKIFEIIGKIKDNSLIKGYSTYMIEGVRGYQVSSLVDEIKIKSQYYIKKENQITKIKLKKKVILNLMDDKKTRIISFTKKEKLSFKKEKDLRKIIAYYNSL